MAEQRSPFSGLAILKEEGGETSFDPGMPETPEQKVARLAWQKAARAALHEFEDAMERVPETLQPGWVAFHYALAEKADERGAITYLRRLVLWRMASGRIEHPRECAAIVMPEGEEPFSSGW